MFDSQVVVAVPLQLVTDDLAAKLGRRVERVIPVSEQLEALFPNGGLQRGTTVTVVGSTSVALAVVAHATQSGLWCAALGMPNLGVVAAADAGVRLERFPLVPNPGHAWPEVTAALIDGFDLVLMHSTKSIHPNISRRLESRLRHRGSVLVLVAPMPNVWGQTDLVIRQASVENFGLGRGHGYINRRRFTLLSEGRGAAARPRRAELVMS